FFPSCCPPALYALLFFFSSRRRHTRSKRDWSSDVCSSDLHFVGHHHHGHAVPDQILHDFQYLVDHFRIQRRGRLIKQHGVRVHEIGRASCRDRGEGDGVAV